MREEKNATNAAVIRVHKDRNYTVMSNKHLFQRDLSLKGKGLMSLFLALPDDWNYSIAGLCKILKEGRDALNTTIAELKEFGYIDIERKNAEKGRFSFIYHIYERGKEETACLNTPYTENPCTVNACMENPQADVPTTESPSMENPEQLNIKKLNTNKSRTNYQSPKEEKKSFGEFSNVFLANKEIQKLKVLYRFEVKFNEAIEILSSYKESSGKKYKSDYAVLNRSNWVYKKVFPNGGSSTIQPQSGKSSGGKYSNCG